ncbi:MAG: hypothetical protein ACI4V5_04455 [Prevotella sp.]
MILHIFNPEHDMALAIDKAEFTLPHTIQELRTNLGFLPALWAADGDAVLVDDIPYAIKALKQMRRKCNDILFLTQNDIRNIPFSEIKPWGWDINIRHRLLSSGVKQSLLPDNEKLLKIKDLSSRRQTEHLLPYLRDGIEDTTCGKSHFTNEIQTVLNYIERYKNVVIKTPWSSSGRGIRYISHDNIMKPMQCWISNIIRNQGGISVEPCYNKVKDFAMEFFADTNGNITYSGLSVFDTEKCNYHGNLIASEDVKNKILGKYIDLELLDITRQRLTTRMQDMLKGIYTGPFGVDMMIVAKDNGNGYLLHPCVEVNLRNTMGHLANALYDKNHDVDMMMHIVHDVNYRLKIDYIGNIYAKVI